MKTDDLVAALSQHVESISRRLLGRTVYPRGRNRNGARQRKIIENSEYDEVVHVFAL
jgi:hypothetical protein